MTDETAKPNEIAAPRVLKGRRARANWRRLAPIVEQKGALNALSETQLAAICTQLARIQEDLDGATVSDWDDLRKLARPLGLML